MWVLVPNEGPAEVRAATSKRAQFYEKVRREVDRPGITAALGTRRLVSRRNRQPPAGRGPSPAERLAISSPPLRLAIPGALLLHVRSLLLEVSALPRLP